MIEILFLIAVASCLVLLFSTVESWIARLLLVAVVAAPYYFFGEAGGMAAAAIVAVGLLIRRQVPEVSRL